VTSAGANGEVEGPPQSDLGMHGHAVAQAERKLAGGSAPVYMYEFGWRVPSAAGSWAIHSGDVPFFFDNVDVDTGAYGPEDTAAAREALDPEHLAPVLADETSKA
jgi:para-nitrobenzyl esterase